ncbi:MAG TPA: hypothetical protein VKR30_05445 [Candidatus Limnocylindrales bacterium]|nr:hypothetical protein [Candidatus Limnocylindrales bacterium]
MTAVSEARPALRYRAPTLGTVWLFLAVALPTLAALLVPIPAVDLAYQLRAGGMILDTGQIPSTDTWTFTAFGAPWTDQQWGAQVLLTLVYRATGWGGLFLLRAALVALTFGLILALVLRRDPLLNRRVAALLVLTAFVVMLPTLALRPQLFAIALFVLVLLILATRPRGSRVHSRWIWAIPLITLAWANLHGSFPLVFVLLALALFADALGGNGVVELGGPTLASIVASCITPFGSGVWAYVVQIGTNSTIASRVSEWRPPGLTDLPGILFYLSVAAVVVWLIVRARRRGAGPFRPDEPGRPPLRHPRPFPASPALLTLLLFAALTAYTGRGLAWWPPAALFVVTPLLRVRRDADGSLIDPQLEWGSPAKSSADRRSPLNAVIIGVIVLVGIVRLPFWQPTSSLGVPAGTLSYAPTGIASTLADLRFRTSRGPLGFGRVWAPQVWGSWLELEAPMSSYGVDSRIEIFPSSVWADYDTVEGARPGWQDVLLRDQVGVVVTTAGTPLDAAVRADAEFAQLYSDTDGTVWYRDTRVGG